MYLKEQDPYCCYCFTGGETKEKRITRSHSRQFLLQLVKKRPLIGGGKKKQLEMWPFLKYSDAKTPYGWLLISPGLIPMLYPFQLKQFIQLCTFFYISRHVLFLLICLQLLSTLALFTQEFSVLIMYSQNYNKHSVECWLYVTSTSVYLSV